MRDVNQVLRQIRHEFDGLPGLRLTMPQAQRLWDLEPKVCRAVLDALVAAEFLRETDDGSFRRCDSPTATIGTRLSALRALLARVRRGRMVPPPYTRAVR